MAIVRDITERKRSERALQQSRAELRDLYAKLNTLREVERKKVALEIHDHAGQMITALKFDISSAGHNAGAFPESKAKRVVLAKLESAQKFLGDVHVYPCSQPRLGVAGGTH
jgi:signal transduction histidine kinase